MTIGFIGLGRMGSGLARRLEKTGVELVVFDANLSASRGWERDRTHVADSVAAVARQCEVILTSLPGPTEVEAVILGPDGVAANMREGSALIETTTSSPALARRIHRVLREQGNSMLDAPVSGGPSGAASGELAVWVGGDRDVFDAHVDILTTIGGRTRYVGPSGSGTVIKLVHNLAVGMQLAAMAETASLGVEAGIDPADLWQALSQGSLGRQTTLDMIKTGFMAANFEPGNALELFHKDLRLATDMAREHGVPMRIADATFAETSEAVARGWGAQDSQSFMKLQLERLGLKIAVDPDLL